MQLKSFITCSRFIVPYTMPFDLIYSVSVKLQATRYFANLIYSNQIISYACMFCENINDMPRWAISSPTSAGLFPGERHYPPTLAAAAASTITNGERAKRLLNSVTHSPYYPRYQVWKCKSTSSLGWQQKCRKLASQSTHRGKWISARCTLSSLVKYSIKISYLLNANERMGEKIAL